MKIQTFLPLFILAAAMASCQSETVQEDLAPKHVLSVKASLPNSIDSRAVITYGNYEDKNKEFFEWNDDYLTLFNITRFSEFHTAYEAPLLVIDTDKSDKKNATFIFAPDKETSRLDGERFYDLMQPGDVICAILGSAGSASLAECKEGTTNLISYFAGSTFYDQKIYNNPTTADSFYGLRHINQMMRMYDIVRVGEDGKIPDLHFKHLSAIMRVTLRNETGAPLFTKPSDLVFTYPTGSDCAFIYGFSRVSVVENEPNSFSLVENFDGVVNDDPDIPQSDKTTTHSDKTTLKINEKTQTTTLAPHETYELYAVVAPRIGYSLVGRELIIDLYDGVESGYGKEGYNVDKYSITIDDFNRPIEPGKRYWFNLTAVKEEVNGTVETKLVFSNQWTPPHPDSPDE